jgi:hypothetical protein
VPLEVVVIETDKVGDGVKDEVNDWIVVVTTGRVVVESTTAVVVVVW